MISIEDLNPADGSPNTDAESPISFRLVSSAGSIVQSSLSVSINSVPAITAGAFESGFFGSITPDGDDLVVLISTHPALTRDENAILAYVEDSEANAAYISFVLLVQLGVVNDLRAKSWCKGKRIDLRFTIPDGVTRISIKRSKFSFLLFYDDVAETLYEGTPTNLDSSPITGYTDGVITSSIIRSSGVPLDENTFYYYTIFVTYDESDPRYWLTSNDAQAQGLSIPSYPQDWFYRLLPEHFRRSDADPKRGANQYLLRKYCSVLECGLNLQRGWLEAIPFFRDPERMPAGRLEEASNQKGILSAQVASLGMPPERAFDAGVLRRLIAGLIPVYKKKGACDGLVSFVKTFTGWDSRCDEAIEPLCGVNRLFQTWDASSYILKGVFNARTQMDISGLPGAVVLNATSFTAADGVTPVLPPMSANEPSFNFIIDALGTFYCVDTVTNEDPAIVTFTNPTAKARAEFSGNGTASGTRQITLTSVDANSTYGGWPWQFSGDEPQFAQNALKGLHLLDSSNVKHKIESNTTTDLSGNTVVIVETGTGNPTSGTYYVAYDFVVWDVPENRDAIWSAKFYVGEFSLTYDPVWDSRHLIEESEPGPFSLLAGFGSSEALGASATPSDITIWLQNVHEVIGRVTAVGANTLTDTNEIWVNDQWADYYVLPTWEHSTLYKIVGNTSNTLIVYKKGLPSLLKMTAVGQEYVILSKKNALKYEQLVKALPSFAPFDARLFVKFEEYP